MALLEVEDLATHHRNGGRVIRAVDGVSFALERGETLGVVGESGCGKSTLGKTVMRLVAPTAGAVRFDGVDITRLGGRSLLPFRRRMQMVFQDPYGSLNPRHSIGTILESTLVAAGWGDRGARRRTVIEMLERVGLSASALTRYPHAFSGGQRQRIGIARGLILRPELVVCDEPVSALDVSIQAQILNLLADLKREFGLSYLFTSHDLSVVRYFSDRILVMYLGRVVETATAADLWRAPRHPYTQTLLGATPAPVFGPRQAAPSPVVEVGTRAAGTNGCRFAPRCPRFEEACGRQDPPLRTVGPDHFVACDRL